MASPHRSIALGPTQHRPTKRSGTTRAAVGADANFDAHRRLLRTERFTTGGFGAPARNEPFEVELRRSGTSVTVTPGQSVLRAITDAGVAVLSSCGQGLCGTCETGVLEGEPDHRDALLDDTERATGNRMFVCVSRSRSDRLVLDL